MMMIKESQNVLEFIDNNMEFRRKVLGFHHADGLGFQESMTATG